MVDRVEIRSLADFTNPRLQALASSPYAQTQLRLTGSNNSRGLSRRTRQRRERELITQEFILRTLNVDRNRRRSYNHPFEVAAKRSGKRSFDILGQNYKKEAYGRMKTRERSAPGSFTRGENDGGRRIRVSSAHHRISAANQNLSESNQQENHLPERANRLNVPVEERHACQITIMYGSKIATNPDKEIGDEIIVMQQYSTGENMVIYRGFLVKGESFSFKSQRRPTSALSLTFYAKGLIDSIVNDCCEFQYGRRNPNRYDHSEFMVDCVRKANPCEKCRRANAHRALIDNDSHTSKDRIRKQHSQTVDQSHSIPNPHLPAVENPTNELSDKKHEHKKSSKYRKHTTAVVPLIIEPVNDKRIPTSSKSKKTSSQDQTLSERSTSIDCNLLELSLRSPIDSTSSKSNSLVVKEKSVQHHCDIKGKKPSGKSITEDRNKPQESTPTDVVSLESGNASASDPGNVLERLMTQLKEHLKSFSHKSELSAMKRHQTSVESLIYVLDSHVSISAKEKQHLRGLVNCGFTFDDLNAKECLEFIPQVVNERIILILSKTSLANLDQSIRDGTQVCLTYVVHDESDGSKKTRGSYTNVTRVCKQLAKDLVALVDDHPNILSVSSDDTSDSAFAYVQILKDILLETDAKADLKKEMLQFCREEYADNAIQLKFIDEFDCHFRADQAVNWYKRRETFLFKMLTRAFRTPDPDILFQLRFFIQHLHRQLKSNASAAPLTVYRTIPVPKKNFDKIQQNSGGFLSLNQFLFTNKTKQTVELPSIKSDYISVEFHIELEATVPRLEIETIPDEILITPATIFRISKVQSIDEETFIVKLISDHDTVLAVQSVTKSVREAARGHCPLVRMAKLMRHMEDMHHTEHFCLILMNDPIAMESDAAKLTTGGLFHSLGTFYYEQEQYDRALSQLQKSLEVYARVLPADDIKLSPTYNNMGSIYHKQGLDELALQLHQKAYDIQVKSSNPDIDSVAAYAGNIASVLMKLQKYDEAIIYLQRDLQIQQRLDPNQDHINLAVKYHNLAGAQFRLQNYNDALENYQKCLKIEIKLHPSNHPTVAVTYFNMATAFEALGQLEEAKATIGKAIERLLLTRNDDDDEIQMHRQYEARLQQKLWVKHLFDTT